MTITKTIKMLAVAGVISLGSLTTYAKVPSDSSVEEYIKLMKLNENFTKDTKQGMINGFVLSALANVQEAHPNLSDDKKAQITALLEKEASLIANEFLADKQYEAQSLAIIKQAIIKHLNQAQIDALNNFYRTPIGQQAMDAQTAMVQDMLAPLMTNAAQKTQEIQKQPHVIKRQTALQAKIAEILY